MLMRGKGDFLQGTPHHHIASLVRPLALVNKHEESARQTSLSKPEFVLIASFSSPHLNFMYMQK
jgi:hypothetical protein